MTTDYVIEGCEDFERFAANHTDADIDDTTVYLEALLAQWLYIGMGIESTAADYDHFLQVTIAITDALMKGTICLDYSGPDAPPYKRHIPGLVSPKTRMNVLTRMGYDQLVFQTTEGRRSEELAEEVRKALRMSGLTLPQPTK